LLVDPAFVGVRDGHQQQRKIRGFSGKHFSIKTTALRAIL